MVEINSSWLNALIFLTATWFLSKWVNNQYLYKRLKCKAVNFEYGDYTFGIYTVIRILWKGPGIHLVDETRQKLESQEYGTYTQRIVSSNFVFTKNSENIKALLATQFDEFGLSDRYKHFKPFLGKSIFTTDGEDWKSIRALARPQFAREQIAHVQALETHVESLAKHIQNTKGKPFNVQDLFFKYTYDTATEFLFGSSDFALQDETIGYPVNENAETRVAFGKAIGVASIFSVFRAFVSNSYWLINPKRYRDACETVHTYIGKHVSKALALSEKELEEKSKGGYTMLYELVKVIKDPVIIEEQLLSLFLAGRYTTASTLGWTMFELGRNPEILTKLRDEIERNFGVGNESRVSEITFESLKKCSYLQAVINETLRVWPVVPQNSRVANKDTTLPRGGGKDGLDPILIRKGRTVVWLTYSIHRDREIFGKDADVFRPERWLEPSMPKQSWVYMPFGGGPRICLGQQFALTEVAYTIVRLLQLFPKVKGEPTSYPPPVRVQMALVLISCDVSIE